MFGMVKSRGRKSIAVNNVTHYTSVNEPSSIIIRNGAQNAIEYPVTGRLEFTYNESTGNLFIDVMPKMKAVKEVS